MPEVIKIKNHTFKELADHYHEWCSYQRSYINKRSLINQLVRMYANLPLRRFNTLMVEQLQTLTLNRGKRPATANRLIRTLAHMFTKAVDWNMVEEVVLKRIRKVKMLPENNQRVRYLEQDECKRLIEACSPHLQPIVIMALNTGMRKGEILHLKWDNVDLPNGLILLEQEQTKNHQRREIPISPTLDAAMRRLPRRLDVPYVFFNPETRKPWNDLKLGFKSAVRRAKITDFRFHDLRHTFASHLVMSGSDLVLVKELLGHRTLEMTLRYAHLAKGHRANAILLLDQRLNQNVLYKNCTISGFGG